VVVVVVEVAAAAAAAAVVVVVVVVVCCQLTFSAVCFVRRPPLAHTPTEDDRHIRYINYVNISTASQPSIVIYCIN